MTDTLDNFDDNIENRFVSAEALPEIKLIHKSKVAKQIFEGFFFLKLLLEHRDFSRSIIVSFFHLSGC